MGKFSTMEQREDKYGFKYVTDSVLVGDKQIGCLQCGEPTEFVEVYTEAHFCSEECVMEWDKYYYEMCEGMQNLCDSEFTE